MRNINPVSLNLGSIGLNIRAESYGFKNDEEELRMPTKPRKPKPTPRPKGCPKHEGKRTVIVDFTSEEAIATGKKLARALVEVGGANDHAKRTRKDLKNAIAKKEEQVQRFRKLVSAGGTEAEVATMTYFDIKGGHVLTFREDNNELIENRKPTNAEIKRYGASPAVEDIKKTTAKDVKKAKAADSKEDPAA